MNLSKILKLASSIIICFAAAGIGSLLTMPSISTWYAGLDKPFFNPPNWIFGPVWTLLFLMMAVALYFILLRGTQDKEAKKGIIIFFVQLVLNVLWSGLFFAAHNLMFAFFDIIILWLAIFFTILQFKKVNKIAAYLLIPYLIWVSFASILNFAIWRFNL
jgi:benzodiazapine receptor